MEKKTYKYIVAVETLVWDNGDYFEDDSRSRDEQTEIINEDPLIAREIALTKAKSIEEIFEDEEEEHLLPPIKMGYSFVDEQPDLWMTYSVYVYLEIDDKKYCIFSTNDPLDEFENVLEGLLKEYEVLEKNGINLSDSSELVKYYDWHDKKSKETFVLSNGMESINMEVNVGNAKIKGLILDDIDNNSKQKTKEKKFKKNQKADIIFKSTYKYRFNHKKNTIEISLRTSSDTIPADLEKAINELIRLWTSKK